MAPNGWREWSKHVLKELERLSSSYETLDKKIDKINGKMTMMMIKLAALSATVALLVAIAVILIEGSLANGG